MSESEKYERAEELLRKEGQLHILSCWRYLDEKEREDFLDDVFLIDFDFLRRLRSSGEKPHSSPKDLFSPNIVSLNEACTDENRERGVHALKSGKLAAFVVAGGQGSRLGFDGPKGMFPISPVEGKSFFRLFCEQILFYCRKFGVDIPFMIMTSHANHDATVKYFSDNSYFGLRRDSVFIFPQNLICSLDFEGRLILADKGKIFRNPDGHGGALSALKQSGILSVLQDRGIEYVSYFQVDNPLVNIVDPVFLGLHISASSELSSKAIVKKTASEKMGVFAKDSSGRNFIIEYSDLPVETAEKKDSDGLPYLRWGNVAVHLFNLSFIKGIIEGGDFSLPFHAAKKKIPVWTPSGFSEIEGFKYEKFIFDTIPLAERTVIMESSREEEFAPVKNKDGEDSIVSARAIMSRLHRGWLSARGCEISPLTKTFEISPLFACAAQDIPLGTEVPSCEKVYIGE